MHRQISPSTVCVVWDRVGALCGIPKGHCQLGRADGNANCIGMSVDGQGESDKLVPTTVDLDDPGGGEKPHVCLGGTKTQIGEVESHGC